MRILKIALSALVVFSLNISCYSDKDDDPVIVNTEYNEISDFVYKAMNAVYLYKSHIPNLANDRFKSIEEYAKYLNGYSKPEDLFESLIYDRKNVDRFSIIAADGVSLLQQLAGVYKSNGLEFLLYRESNTNNKVIGVIKLVLNNSVASEMGLKRGQIFNAVDGVQMTTENLGSLLNKETYTLNFAVYNGNGGFDPTSEKATLTKVEYNENPVYLNKTFDLNGTKVGYLFYNGFTAGYNAKLNDAFGELKANNVQELVLDLRYNGGGSVNSAVLLGSMITGQFYGQVFSKLIYNEDLSEANFDYLFLNELEKGVNLNSLNLKKVYVLTTDASASASELIINSLKPYITVVQIGENTRGKTQASMPIYDSPDLGPKNANPNHEYVILPLIANSVNKNSELVPSSGLVPDVETREYINDLGTIGDANEPFLSIALDLISGNIARPLPVQTEIFAPLEIKDDNKIKDLMFIDKLQ